MIRPQTLLAGMDPINRVVGKTLYTFPPQTTPGVLAVNPFNFGLRLPAFSGIFQEFRFVEMVIKIHCNTSASTMAVGYFKDPTSGTLSSLVSVYEAVNSILITNGDTVPQTLSLGRGDLLGGLRSWYALNTLSSEEAADRSQGYIAWVTSSSTGSYVAELAYIIEFRGATNTLTD